MKDSHRVAPALVPPLRVPATARMVGVAMVVSREVKDQGR